MGLIIFVLPDSASQVALGTLIAVGSLVFHVSLGPFYNKHDNIDQGIALSCISMTLYSALLLKTETTRDEGYDIHALATTLIVVNICALLAAPIRFIYVLPKKEPLRKAMATFPATAEVVTKFLPGLAAYAAEEDEEPFAPPECPACGTTLTVAKDEVTGRFQLFQAEVSHTIAKQRPPMASTNALCPAVEQ